MKRILILSLLVFAAVLGNAATPLRFNADGKLKIVQFTDNHYKWGKKASRKTVECIEAVLESEKPDFIIFTGDLVYSKDVEKSIDAILQPVVDSGIPFAFVFGNHDAEFDRSYAEIYDQIASKPNALMPPRGDAESPDYTVEVASSTDSASTAYTFYCLDSHRFAPVKGCGKYAWLNLEQILWYKAKSDSLRNANDGSPVPALMFFHIPLPEIGYAYEDTKSQCIGSKGESVCSPKLNSGMFTAIKEQGDVRGVFFGHDHDNDFAALYCDVMLGYGRYSGGKTVYNHIGTNGARVIEINENNGDIDTWIRLRTGGTINPFSNRKEK